MKEERKMKTIVIDPGHTANYNSGVAPGYYEGNAMWKMACYLKEELEKGGAFHVVLTKKSLAENPGLQARGHVAVNEGAWLFLSLHTNATGDSSRHEDVYGITVIRSIYRPDSEDLGNKLADAVRDVMAPATGVTFNRGVTTRKGGGEWDYYSVIFGAMNNATDAAKAGTSPVQHALIIEHGFHTNSRECKFLNNDENLAKIAQAEARVIREHCGAEGSTESPEFDLPLSGGGEKDIYDYFKGKGLNDVAAAVMVGQAYAESRYNSCNVQDTYEKKLGMTDAEYTAAVDSGRYGEFVYDKAGYGLWQWTWWSRKQGLLELARQRGVSVGDFSLQLDYAWKELNESYPAILATLRSTTDIKAACDVVTILYEAPADQSPEALDRRVGYAKAAYDKYAAKQLLETAEVKPAENGVIGKIKVIYEGADGLNVHTTPEWGSHNLNTKDGPVHGGVYRVTDKIKVGGADMYRLYSGAGYITADERYVTFTSAADQAPAPAEEIRVGDEVKVLKAEKYGGGTFKTWYDRYTVLKINGDRAVIGIGNVITTAINVRNLVVG